LELLALGVWVGGLLVLIGAVIPAVFNTLGGQDAGGFFLTRVFEGYNRFVMAAFLVLLCGATWRWRIRGPVGVSHTEILVLGAMAMIAGLIIFVLHPQAASLQAQAYSAADDAARKAAFEAFFRIHMPIRSLYVVNLVLGIVLLGMKVGRLVKLEERSA
jgi:uncharacterized membrane protein